MNQYGDVLRMVTGGDPRQQIDPGAVGTPVLSAQPQAPRAIGGFVGGDMPAPAMTTAQPSGDPRLMLQTSSGQMPAVSGDPRQMAATGATTPPLAAPQSASNMYADYLKNRQQNLSDYLSGVR